MINKMTVIGLTGGSGAGKGEVSQCFLLRGIKVLDTDKVSRKVCEKGTPCLTELVRYFGQIILREDGTLDRHRLADLVFCEPDEEKKANNLSALNRITHKYILEYIATWLEEREKEGCTAAVVDAPQIFESGYNKHCDYVIGVIADEEVRVRRIISRDTIKREMAVKRISSQKSNQFFMENCDFIVYNNAGLEALGGQVENILNKINCK